MVKINFSAVDRPTKQSTPILNMPKLKGIQGSKKAPARIGRICAKSTDKKEDATTKMHAWNLYHAIKEAWDSDNEDHSPRLNITYKRYDEQKYRLSLNAAAQENLQFSLSKFANYDEKKYEHKHYKPVNSVPAHAARIQCLKDKLLAWRRTHASAVPPQQTAMGTGTVMLNIKTPKPQSQKHKFSTHDQQKKLLTRILIERPIVKPALKFGTREQKEKSLETIFHKRIVVKPIPMKLKINIVPLKLKIKVLGLHEAIDETVDEAPLTDNAAEPK